MPKTVSSELPILPFYVYSNLSKIKHSDYKKIEIQAIRTEKDGDKFIARIVTSCDPAPIEMFSVYLRNHNGCAECIADFATGPEALAYANLLSVFGWEIGGRAMTQYVIRSISERGYWKNDFGWYSDPKEATLYDSETDVVNSVIMANAEFVRAIDQIAFDLDSESHNTPRKGSPLTWRVMEEKDGCHGIESKSGMVLALVRDVHDAKFIVKAANTHSTLVDAIEDTVEWLTTGKVSGVGFDQLAMIDNYKAILKQVA